MPNHRKKKQTGPNVPKTAHSARAAVDIKLVSTLPKNAGVSASTTTVEQRNNVAAFRVTSHSSLYQVQIIGLITAWRRWPHSRSCRAIRVSYDSVRGARGQLTGAKIKTDKVDSRTGETVGKCGKVTGLTRRLLGSVYRF